MPELRVDTGVHGRMARGCFLAKSGRPRRRGDGEVNKQRIMQISRGRFPQIGSISAHRSKIIISKQLSCGDSGANRKLMTVILELVHLVTAKRPDICSDTVGLRMQPRVVRAIDWPCLSTACSASIANCATCNTGHKPTDRYRRASWMSMAFKAIQLLAAQATDICSDNAGLGMDAWIHGHIDRPGLSAACRGGLRDAPATGWAQHSAVGGARQIVLFPDCMSMAGESMSLLATQRPGICSATPIFLKGVTP